MNRFYFNLFICVFIINCKNPGTNKPKQNHNFLDSIHKQKIKFLDSIHLLKFNDSAKWRLYTIFCDDSCSSGAVYWDSSGFPKEEYKQFNKTPLSFVDLKLMYIDRAGDSLSLLYDFVYKDSIIVSRILPNKHIFHGVIFDVKSDSLIGYVSGEAIITVAGDNSRFVNPLQPDVRKFLSLNLRKLNPWLIEQVKKRGLIQ